MKMFPILNLISVTLVGLASLLQAHDGPVNVSLGQTQEETFNKLCINEYKAKLEHDNYLGLDGEDEWFEKYNELMEARIVLGARLNIHFCPPELIEIHEDHDMEKIWLVHDEKCKDLYRTSRLCFKFQEARQVNSDELLKIELMNKEESACRSYKFATKARKLFARNHLILKPCGLELRKATTELADQEAEKWLNSLQKSSVQPEIRLKPIYYRDEAAIEASSLVNNKKKDKSSKFRNLFGCFTRPEAKN